jgi:hypothetical protein
MEAVLIAFVILWFALAAWVYFDAAERDKAAIVWAGLVLTFSWIFFIPLILYVIFRDTGHRRLVPPGGGRRQYLYIASFAGLATLLTGLALIITTTIIRLIADDGVDRDGYRGAIAGGISSVIIGAAVWVYHWVKASDRLDTISDDQEFRATFHLHRVYVYTVLGIAWITVFVTGLWTLGGALGELLDVKEVQARDWVPAFGPMLVALVTIAYHYLFVLELPWFKDRQERFEKIDPPPLIEPNGHAPFMVPVMAGAVHQPSPSPAPASPSGRTAPRFCTNCGVPVQPGDRFCAACSAPVRGVD